VARLSRPETIGTTRYSSPDVPDVIWFFFDHGFHLVKLLGDIFDLLGFFLKPRQVDIDVHRFCQHLQDRFRALRVDQVSWGLPHETGSLYPPQFPKPQKQATSPDDAS